MKWMRKRSIWMLPCLFINLILLPYDQAFVDHAHQKYITSFGVAPEEPKKENNLEMETIWQRIRLLFRPINFDTSLLNEFEKRELCLRAVQTAMVPYESVIDQGLINKMELFQGEGAPLECLASRLTNHYDLVTTEMGKKQLVEMLAQPVRDLNVIQQRQALLEELTSNPSLLNQCERLLQKVAGTPESHLLTFFKEDTGVNIELFKRVYWNRSWTTPLNNFSGALELGTRFSNLGTAFSTLWLPGAMLRSYLNWDHGIEQALRSQNHNFDDWTPERKKEAIENRKEEIRQLWKFLLSEMTFKQKAVWGSLLIVAPITGYTIGALNALSSARINKNICNYMQEYLIGVATVVNNIKQLGLVLRFNQAFAHNFKPLRNLLNLAYGKKHSPKFAELMGLLQTNTFRGEASFFSLTGRILRAYSLIRDEQVVDEFKAALSALGELDALVAIAKKINECQDGRMKYSFVEFEKQNTPMVSAKQFWNPFVDYDQVVANDIEFNTNEMRNMILTGPNTGGKSTVLKALMVNMILAHTCGIACADEFVITPFTKLTCHMNITDDTAGGVSLFKAEINRAHELMDMVRNLPIGQFAFIIIDEIFTGTAPEKAEELSYKYIKQLSEFPNVIFIGATHFKKLVELETETNNVCKNYHMGVEADENGKVTKYTYTLEPGPSQINNAEQIAAEEGIF